MGHTRTLAVRVLAGGLLVSALWPAPVHAQHRRGRVVVRPVHPVVVARGYYARPYSYNPWLMYSWYPYAFPFGGYPPYPWYGAVYDQTGSFKLDVTPRNTEVFIDGYLAGVVDDFDGFLQRLHAPPGEHEIELYLPGHRSLKQKVYLQPRATYRIRHAMIPLAAGELDSPRPVPINPPDHHQGARSGREPESDAPSASGDQPVSMNSGRLSIRVQPADADVLIDGELWQGAGAGSRLVVNVPQGSHRIGVRKEGYEPFSVDVNVSGGATETVNISLPAR